MDKLDQVLETFLGEGAPILILIGAAIVAVLLLWILVSILDVVRTVMRRWSAGAELGVRLSKSFQVKPAKAVRGTGSFVLVYPRWRAANKDGTRNFRYRSNSVVRGFSVLELGRWRIMSRSVFDLYGLVTTLRSRGHEIALSNEEVAKLGKQEKMSWAGGAADDLHDRFSGSPTDFEEFCAELYSNLGYRVEVTPRTGDGGFDLRMFRGGVKTLVECKCFKAGNSVGRPILQKLFGANAIEGASHLILVTTSTFSGDAIAYARAVGIELVDGAALVALCDRVWGSQPFIYADAATALGGQLSREDLLERIPADIRGFRPSFRG